MRNHYRSLLLFGVLVFGLTVIAQAQEITPLEPGKTITRPAKRGETHTYQVPLTTGKFIRIIVEQNDLNISISLVAPDNKTVRSTNVTEAFSPASLSWEATASGAYKVVIRFSSPDRAEGSYQIQLNLKDATTTQDKQRVTAEQLMSDITRFGAQALPLEKKLERYKEVVRIWRELGDRSMESRTHEAMAREYTEYRKYEQAQELLRQALVIKRELSDQLGIIYTLSNLGMAMRQERDAMLDKTSERAEQLYNLDEDYHQQALTLSREIKHRGAERFILIRLLALANQRIYPEKSFDILEQVLVIDRESNDRTDESAVLRLLGMISITAKRDDDYQRYLGQSLVINRAQQNRLNEASVLQLIGESHYRNNRKEEALQYFDQAIFIYRELKDQEILPTLLLNTGQKYGLKSQYENAQRYFDESIAIYRTAKNRRDEAQFLWQIGHTYALWGQYEKALEYFGLAIPIYPELKDRFGEALAYDWYGNTYLRMGHYGKSIESLERSLAIHREQGRSTFFQLNLLRDLGVAYLALNRNEKAIEYLEQSVATFSSSSMTIVANEDVRLGNLAAAYLHLERYDKALDYVQQSLTISRKFKRLPEEGVSLITLGRILHKQGNYEQAIESFELAIPRVRRSLFRTHEASAQAHIAESLRSLGRIDKALEADILAGQIARSTKNRDYESYALRGLMQNWKARNQPQLAIFFGKQSVNLSQEMRSDIRRLDPESQQSFLQSKESNYRELADLLIVQGRLPEAEQVIRMLKEEEYFEYVRRDIQHTKQSEKAALTREEAAIEKRYREIADQLTILGTERGELMGKPARTTAEDQRLAKLEADLTVANQMFQKFLDGLATEMAKQKDGGAQVKTLRDAQGLMEDLRELGKGTVALYTLVGEKKFRVILTTPDVQKAYEAPISEAALNRKILALRAALQNPKLDPRPAAQELYQILFAPLAKDLRAMKATTLMWSLDGVLRYVPMGALYDGEKYLVEHFRHVVFTPASNARLKDQVSANWQALGLGVTRGFGDKIPALPAVADEMRGIIREGSNTKGVLPGTIKLDEQFTQEAMLTGLRQKPSVVHVASHFQFKPGNETDSALLLGDGKFLSLAQIKVTDVTR